MLGVSAIATGLGTGANVAYADSPSDDKSQEYEEGMKEHQNLQAYNYPLVAAELTTTKGQLPSAQSGVANWNSLPAGTTATWDKQPTVDQTGKSYGTVIVTFPDKSASVIAVYVTVNPDASSQSSSSEEEKAAQSSVDTNEVKEATADAQEKVAAKNESAAKATSQTSAKSATVNNSESENTNQSNKENSADKADNANSTNGSDNNSDQVIVKDVKTEYNEPDTASTSQQPTTKSSQISNTATESNAELPQTQAKQSGVALISGLAMAIVGLGLALINKLKFEK